MTAMLGEYAGYVLSAYGIVAVSMAGLIARALIAARRLEAELTRVDAASGRRP